MKNLLLVAFVLICVSVFYSCQSSPTLADAGETIINIKKGVNDTVPFKCTGCVANLKTMRVFTKVIDKISEETKDGLKYPLSFNPENITMSVDKQDSLILYATNEKLENVYEVTASVDYIANNAYGNELEGDTEVTFYIQNDSITDFAGKLKLPALTKTDDGGLSRNLTLVNALDASEYIAIMAATSSGIIAISSHSCIDEDARLKFHFVGEDVEFKKYSFNDFNCKGQSYYYNFSDKEREIIKNNEIEFVSLSYDGDLVLCSVPDNEKDFFKQWIELK